MWYSRQTHIFSLVYFPFCFMLSGVLAEQADANVVPYRVGDIIASSETNMTDPVPYGTANNTVDHGWIWWDNGDYLTVDFGVPQTITSVRPYSVYAGGARGALWKMEHSDDNLSYSINDGGEFDFRTCSNSTDDCGVDDNGDPELAGNGYAGWYQYDFNLGLNPHRYWKLSQTQVTAGHAPRTGELQFLAGDFTPASSYQWKADGVGQWSNGASWSPGGIPKNGDQTVVLGSHTNITGNTNVSVNSPAAVGRIEFNNADMSYVISGAGSLDLMADSVGGSPSVDVQAGNHEFQVRTNLQADTYLNVEAGSIPPVQPPPESGRQYAHQIG